MAEYDYKYVAPHAGEVVVGDKVVMAEPGQMFELPDKDVRKQFETDNKAMLDDNSVFLKVKRAEGDADA
jgi:hypothetical protein